MGEAAKAESDLVISRLSAPSRSAWRRVAQNKGNGQANYYQHTQDYERQIHGQRLSQVQHTPGAGFAQQDTPGRTMRRDARKSPAPISNRKAPGDGAFIRYQSSASSSQQRSRHLEMCQQSSKEGFFLRLFLVAHSRFHVQDARELFRAWDGEHVKDQTSRQIVQCNLFAVCELKYVPLWMS